MFFTATSAVAKWVESLIIIYKSTSTRPPTIMEVEKWDASKKSTGPSQAKGASVSKSVHCYKTIRTPCRCNNQDLSLSSLIKKGAHPRRLWNLEWLRMFRIVEASIITYRQAKFPGGIVSQVFFFLSHLHLQQIFNSESSSWNQCSKSLLTW